MCGIFVAIESPKSSEFLIDEFMKIKHRGPDASDFRSIRENTYFGFHRLAINGLTPKGNQPMYKNGVWLVANAEIFNFLELAAKYDIRLETGSDCEILIDLYNLIGEEQMLQEIDGEFAFVLYDEAKDFYIAARDHLGVRGMYMGYQDAGIYFASESKAIAFTKQLNQFPPGHYWNSYTDKITPYFTHDYQATAFTEEEYCLRINTLLTESVEKRMMSERPLGCLLSGGLDSSLVAGILARKLKEKGKQLETFSIGLEGSPDITAAQKVADHIGSKHHSIVCTEQDFLDELEHTVYMLGSYDVTTIRASVGHQLVSRYVRDHSEVKVLFSGETADEFGSYLYFQNAPDSVSFQQESIRLLKDIQFFDMKRGDRSISSAGLEARVPFADKAFVKFFMSIPPEHRMFSDQKIEKYLIRKAFEGEDLIPSEVLWRRKNGFSDSVSSRQKSWSQVIKDHIETLVTDEEFQSEKFKYSPEPPSKEAFFYLKTFEKTYGSHFQLTPYQWLPKWCGDVKDPSARVLEIYQAD
ncbi:asparagine synthase-related protein [Psychroflexus sediminis]|uniref:asparagine synthase (glutamine-hydrolyzing) n=1 Tax=Psychroflexus sediminis TaxID=470826 RepID=A0A1G7VF17_9FLAO|nr:asparagine synthase-related protein [Psychroflexus sediminis]SDG58422.1 asparagine synthase (glutamine-hydrolysing) [Psychroflexus sediminis]